MRNFDILLLLLNPSITMYKLIIALCIAGFFVACKGDQANTVAEAAPAKTTTINTPIKVANNTQPTVDTPPPGVATRTTAPGAAPLGSITNPIMRGAIAQPQRAPIPQPGAAAPPRKVEPPQNAKGVWHFICSAGCKGGSGKAEPCASCGTQLVHNQAYHQ